MQSGTVIELVKAWASGDVEDLLPQDAQIRQLWKFLEKNDDIVERFGPKMGEMAAVKRIAICFDNHSPSQLENDYTSPIGPASLPRYPQDPSYPKPAVFMPGAWPSDPTSKGSLQGYYEQSDYETRIRRKLVAEMILSEHTTDQYLEFLVKIGVVPKILVLAMSFVGVTMSLEKFITRFFGPLENTTTNITAQFPQDSNNDQRRTPIDLASSFRKGRNISRNVSFEDTSMPDLTMSRESSYSGMNSGVVTPAEGLPVSNLRAGLQKGPSQLVGEAEGFPSLQRDSEGAIDEQEDYFSSHVGPNELGRTAFGTSGFPVDSPGGIEKDVDMWGVEGLDEQVRAALANKRKSSTASIIGEYQPQFQPFLPSTRPMARRLKSIGSRTSTFIGRLRRTTSSQSLTPLDLPIDLFMPVFQEPRGVGLGIRGLSSQTSGTLSPSYAASTSTRRSKMSLDFNSLVSKLSRVASSNKATQDEEDLPHSMKLWYAAEKKSEKGPRALTPEPEDLVLPDLPSYITNSTSPHPDSSMDEDDSIDWTDRLSSLTTVEPISRSTSFLTDLKGLKRRWSADSAAQPPNNPYDLLGDWYDLPPSEILRRRIYSSKLKAELLLEETEWAGKRPKNMPFDSNPSYKEIQWHKANMHRLQGEIAFLQATGRVGWVTGQEVLKDGGDEKVALAVHRLHKTRVAKGDPMWSC